MKRNIILVLLVLAACVAGSFVGGCGSCAGGDEPAPVQTQKPPNAPTAGSARQIRAPMMGMMPTDAGAATAPPAPSAPSVP